MEGVPDFVLNPDPNTYITQDYVVLDFETTNLDKGSPYSPDNELLLARWLVNRGGVLTRKGCWGSEYEQHELLADIESVGYIVAHNVKFELGWLERCGYDLASKVVYDTMLADYVIAGNRKWRLNLSACALRRGWEAKESLVDHMIKKGVCPSEIPRRWLEKYCIKDVEICHDLLLDQLPLLKQHMLLPVLYSRCLLTPVLADIEKNGMCLDKERVDERYQEARLSLTLLQAEMDEFTGGINTNSNDQLAEFLFGTLNFAIPKRYNGKEYLTPSGKPQTNEEALGALRGRNKRQREFLKLQKKLNATSNVMSKYLQKLQDCCEENDGVLQATFNQSRTATHRLSSSGKQYKIQLQNVSRDLKPVFKARHLDWVLVDQDAAQLEFRIAVDLAKDKQGLEDIANGFDVHSFSAKTLFDDWTEGDKQLRTKAKAYTFRPLFGGSSGTPREQAYYAAFKERYSGITAMQNAWIDTVLRTKKLQIPSGLWAYWPKTKLTSSGYITNSTTICNLAIQSFSTADLVPLAVVLVWHSMRVRGLKSLLVSTIHDSIIYEAPQEEVATITEIGEYALTEGTRQLLKKLYDYDMEVKLDADTAVGTHWGG